MCDRRLSIVIPTYRREQVLIDTISQLLRLKPAALEILVIDQTSVHTQATTAALKDYHDDGRIQWLRLGKPSITHAMNAGLLAARGEIVLFVDDDIQPDEGLIDGHLNAHASGQSIVAGQVLQPGEEPLTNLLDKSEFSFAFTGRQLIDEFIGCNFSVNRRTAIELGGFDENFVHVAYRYEAEFSRRALAAGYPILFEPKASIRHLKMNDGGTRSFGHHLKTIRPSHAVGAYYYLLRSNGFSRRIRDVFSRPLRAVRTKHHAKHPWWIPATLISEMLGFIWAVMLYIRGPRLIRLS